MSNSNQYYLSFTYARDGHMRRIGVFNTLDECDTAIIEHARDVVEYPKPDECGLCYEEYKPNHWEGGADDLCYVVRLGDWPENE